MSDGRTINVRLPKDLGRKFDALTSRLPALPKSVILRLLLTQQLSRPIEDQVDMIIESIRDGGTASDVAARNNRIQGVNTKDARRRSR